MEGGEEPMETEPMETESCEEEPTSVSGDQNPIKPPSEDQLEEPKNDVTGTEECKTNQVLPEDDDIKSLPLESPAAEQSSACQEAEPVQEVNPSSPQAKESSCETGQCNEESEEEKKAPGSNNIPSEQSAECLPLSNIVKPCSSETSPPVECPTEASKTEEMPLELLDNTEEADPSPVETEIEAVCLPLHRAVQSREEELQTESNNVPADTAVEDEKMLHRECDTLAASVLSVPMESCGCAVEAGVAPCLLTPSASPGETVGTEQRVLNGDICVKVEKCAMDPVDWSVADVVSYFTAAGFGEQAGAFKNQEIDGKSLLLMQRSDVLKGLSIRLGPALKIYEFHIKVLQRSHFQPTAIPLNDLGIRCTDLPRVEEKGVTAQMVEDANPSCVKVEKCAMDPVDWSVADVVSYFTAAGFGEQAGAFKNQEIDGKSLLLMQRSDVLKGLSIRLGPALKIYEFHIKVLQRSHFQVESALC
ncbi:UNVERIFIED_CONTAM: hypothetical protein FKN15_067539 [Acipenser sinensis]